MYSQHVNQTLLLTEVTHINVSLGGVGIPPAGLTLATWIQRSNVLVVLHVRGCIKILTEQGWQSREAASQTLTPPLPLLACHFEVMAVPCFVMCEAVRLRGPIRELSV